MHTSARGSVTCPPSLHVRQADRLFTGFSRVQVSFWSFCPLGSMLSCCWFCHSAPLVTSLRLELLHYVRVPTTRSPHTVRILSRSIMTVISSTSSTLCSPVYFGISCLHVHLAASSASLYPSLAKGGRLTKTSSLPASDGGRQKFRS